MGDAGRGSSRYERTEARLQRSVDDARRRVERLETILLRAVVVVGWRRPASGCWPRT